MDHSASETKISAADINAQYDHTVDLQRLACDPSTSCWVSANAGTGKTHVLVNRVLRLMLAGTRPDRILCLTYTKAAAAEMSNRLLDRELSNWITVDDQDLAGKLHNLLGREATNEECLTARQMFARALETPGGLKVQTIHAFCEKLLQRFPLEAGVPPHFTVLEEGETRDLVASAIDKVLRQAVEDVESVTGRALMLVIANGSEDKFQDLMRRSARHKTAWVDLVEGQAINSTKTSADPSDIAQSLAHLLGLPANIKSGALLDQMAAVISDEDIERASTLLTGYEKKTNQDLAHHLRAAKNAKSQTERLEQFQIAFLTGAKKPRSDSRFITKKAKDDHPDIADLLFAARDQFFALQQQLDGLHIAEASQALLLLANDVVKHYQQSKKRRAKLDFDDLIEETVKLLHSSDQAAWVLYKLDQGLDHILVDEAQDTTPEQWKLIGALSEEFFAGLGSEYAFRLEGEETMSDGAPVSLPERTIFAVGDEKQSIYGFNGAAPEQFAAMGNTLGGRARAAEKKWEKVPLNLSFRSSAPVLEAVDLVFSQPGMAAALSAEGMPVKHYAHRHRDAGLVELWPLVVPEKQSPSHAFAPLDDLSDQDAISILANKIAITIKGWLKSGERLASTGEPIKPGDILILLRKRGVFAAPMIRALKRENIAVAGSDRIIIAEQLAVKDMLALGDFLLLPEDDLALANVLKSPIFDLDDDDLYQLCYRRKGSLWMSLRYFAMRDKKYRPVADCLSRWLAMADLRPPFEFFAKLLEGEGLRQKLIARIGLEAGDALDEFLNQAIHYDDLEPPTMQGFLHWLRSGATEIKRDMEQSEGEVRVMTVHGAKGLEAPIVFLPETCFPAGGLRQESLYLYKEEVTGGGGSSSSTGIKTDEINQIQEHLIWAPSGLGKSEPMQKVKAQIAATDRAENMRLLYVAMTRAKDRLYVAGYKTSKNKIPQDCWYQVIENGLKEKAKKIMNDAGEERYQHSNFDSHNMATIEETGEAPPLPLSPEPDTKPHSFRPDWAHHQAPSEPYRTIPVAPSQIIPYQTPDDDEDIIFRPPGIVPPREMTENHRFLRGKLVHKMLEILPEIDRDARSSAAHFLVRKYGGDLSEAEQESLVAETFKIIDHPVFAPLFGPESRAEVSLVAHLESKKKKVPIIISGQIDRLVVLNDQVLIVDYKTNRPSPRYIGDVAPAYLAQLSAYRVALSEIYSDHQILGALLWTDGPHLMDIPADILDQYERQI